MGNFIKGAEFFLARSSFNGSREQFYEDLAEAIDDKESLREFLSSLRDFSLLNKTNGKAMLFERMLDRMDEMDGMLSHIMKTIVPDEDIMSLRSIDSIREDSERAKGLRFLGTTIRKARIMKGTVVKAMMTPIMVTPVIMAFAFIISVYFIPEYEKIAPPSKWPTIGKMLFFISVMLREYGLVILAAIIGFIVLFIKSFALWSGDLRTIVDEYLPYRLYRDYHAAKFLVALASLVQAKQTLNEALEILGAQTSPWMTWHIRHILDNMNEFPDDYARAFNTGILSKEIHLRLSTYTRRSSFSDGLIRLGTDGLQYVHESVEKSSTKLNIAAIFGTVFVIMFFYGGNLMISQAIQKIMKEQDNKVGLIAPESAHKRIIDVA